MPVKEDPNASDLIAFCKFHSFLVEVQTNAGCTQCMYINNLEIKIVGSSVARSKVVENI